MIALFGRNQEPLEVSFRKLVPWLRIGERATHYLHTYPAKLLPHIAHFFLAAEQFCPVGGTVLDPFGGTGTVALETVLSGRRAQYADSNPLARLIARVKLQVIDSDHISERIPELERRYRKCRRSKPPAVVNISKWYSDTMIRQLVRLRSAILAEADPKIRDFLLVTFSDTTRRMSNADPRLSVPVVLQDESKRKTAADVWDPFLDQLQSNIRRMAELSRLMTSSGSFDIVSLDARDLTIADESVDLIITSPPYAGAQKYIRASSLSLGWLELAENGSLKTLENRTIGREHLPKKLVDALPESSNPEANFALAAIRKHNPTRAAICAVYLQEMETAITEMARVVKPGGSIVLVIGNNTVCGHEFMSSRYLSQMLERAGLFCRLQLLDEIRSRGLMTRRNRAATVITREWVLVFSKSKRACP